MKEVFDMLEGHNEKWLNDNTIYLTKHGSQAYGTNTPTSDLDVRGVCIPPIKTHNLGLLNNFHQVFREFDGIFPFSVDLIQKSHRLFQEYLIRN